MTSIIPPVPQPELVPVFFINLKLKDAPQGVFANTTRNKALALAEVVDGSVTTVKNKLGLELEVTLIKGTDDITSHIADAYNELDCRLYGKTPEGAGVYITYRGVIKAYDNTVAVLLGSSSEHGIDESYVTNSPVINFDESVADKYKWAIKETFLGKGRFVRDAEDTLYVQYYVSVVR